MGGLPKNAQQHSEPKTADAWVKLSLFSKAFIHAAAMAASLLVFGFGRGNLHHFCIILDITIYLNSKTRTLFLSTSASE